MSALVWKNRPIKKLLVKTIRVSGRNNQGRITRYHRGGGCKKLTRIVDYNRYI
jgi:large subunit ribosomal protein L2